MNNRAIGLLLLVASCAAPEPEQSRSPVELAGRTAGPATGCVTLDQFNSLRLSDTDPHTLVLGSGRIIWANHLGQCGFARDDILVTEPTGSQLCSGDIVRSFDRLSRIAGPSCVLGSFVPYKRS